MKKLKFLSQSDEFKLDDYNKAASDYQELVENRDAWIDYSKTLEARIDALISLNKTYCAELSIRRQNDEMRQKLTKGKSPRGNVS